MVTRPRGKPVVMAQSVRRRSALPTLERVLEFMQVMWAVDHQLQSVSKNMKSTLGLTVPQRMSLLLIGRNPYISAAELAGSLHLHPGTISGIVRRLEDAGLITRESDETDARRARLVLTGEGREVNRRRKGTFEDAVRKVLGASSSDDIAGAERVLSRLASQLQAIVGASTSPRASR
jgi:DNA-binding MarR family transcriptional regulator